MIVFKSSDGELFNVEESVAIQCETIKHMIEDDCADSTIPLPNVSSKIMAKVIEYYKRHAQDAAADSPSTSEKELKIFDTEFVSIDQVTLFDLILAANYLNAKKLLDLTCQAVADMIKGQSPEYIREIFNINNDFTPEEEEAIRREHAWVFE